METNLGEESDTGVLASWPPAGLPALCPKFLASSGSWESLSSRCGEINWSGIAQHLGERKGVFAWPLEGLRISLLGLERWVGGWDQGGERLGGRWTQCRATEVVRETGNKTKKDQRQEKAEMRETKRKRQITETDGLTEIKRDRNGEIQREGGKKTEEKIGTKRGRQSRDETERWRDGEMER